ncbi:MAG: YhcH/YjgK/YiaL family protein [Kiritimatiellaeota bacterium]|nr:YhcH/YjgK/YiaL family protein [Kiritimatiellota bacterium]
MIIDTLTQASRYEALHPRFKAAFDFLRGTGLQSLAPGRTEIDGDDLFALTQAYETQPAQGGKLEAHRTYIDIQFVISGEELIGYAPLQGQPPAGPFDAEKDIGFYHGDASFTKLSAGMFAILFPHDAHLPARHLTTPAHVTKTVLKVRA